MLHLKLAAVVSDGERPALEIAAAHLARVLSQASGDTWICECDFLPNMASLLGMEKVNVKVASLLPEVSRAVEPWMEVELRLHEACAELVKGNVPVFVSTVLRHVAEDEDPKLADERRIRIRRLNLLAAEISRRTGAYVIDIDRALAHIGARSLATDYRLNGEVAAEAAGYVIASTLLTNALDAHVSVEVQDAALTSLTESRQEIGQSGSALKKNVLALGKGRRKQIVSPVISPIQENHAGWLVRQVLRGEITPGNALHRLGQAVRRRGVRESAGLLASGISRQFIRKK